MKHLNLTYLPLDGGSLNDEDFLLLDDDTAADDDVEDDDDGSVQDDVLLLLKVFRATHVTDINQQHCAEKLSFDIVLLKTT